jgi:hypothetical protein
MREKTHTPLRSGKGRFGNQQNLIEDTGTDLNQQHQLPGGLHCSQHKWLRIGSMRARSARAGIAIAPFSHDISDHKEENVRRARLIKHNQLCKQLDTEGQQQTVSHTATREAAKSVLKWVRERQELKQVNPRAQFAALFRPA